MMFFIGNSFSMALVTREIRIRPMPLGELVRRLEQEPWLSFWGHANTLAIANTMTGCDLTPRTERPALQLDDDGLPTLFGETARECLLLTPVYRSGFRPVIGQEVSPSDILDWQALQLEWTEQKTAG